MKVFIMRHGEAQQFASSDSDRQLTSKGRQRSQEIARECSELGYVHFDRVLVSPYIRAQQTWHEISAYLSVEHYEICEDITPYGDAEQVVSYLSALADIHDVQTLLIVSHLPLVGYIAAELIADISPPMFSTSGLMGIEYCPDKQKGHIILEMNV